MVNKEHTLWELFSEKIDLASVSLDNRQTISRGEGWGHSL